MRRGRPCEIKRPVQVYTHDRFEILRRHLVENRVSKDAGIVYHRIHSPKGLAGLLHHPVRGIPVPDRLGVRHCFPASCTDLVHDLLRDGYVATDARRGRPEVIHDDLSSFCGGEQRDPAAYAAARTGDDDYSTCDQCRTGHEGLPLVSLYNDYAHIS